MPGTAAPKGHHVPLLTNAEAATWPSHLRDRLREHMHPVRERGKDMPDIRGWRWDARA